MMPGYCCGAIPFPQLELNSSGCISLAQLIEIFQSPISEEHAWALCYQSAKCGQVILTNELTRDLCLMVTSLEDLLIHADGTIHSNSFLVRNELLEELERDDNNAAAAAPSLLQKCSLQEKLISNLAVVIFLALDFGTAKDEERIISCELESLLESMLSADNFPTKKCVTTIGDIKKESGDREQKSEVNNKDRLTSISPSFSFNSIMKICARRLMSRRNTEGLLKLAASHYQNVCRAYVADALELSTFLKTVSRCKRESKSLKTLDATNNENCSSSDESGEIEFDKFEFADWARLWVQVIRDLRHGVKLKETDFCQDSPNEYELTPYEILLEDIRSRRYTLKKVTTDDDEDFIPERMKQGAHAIILEFIRSRPPLRKVAERVLDPPLMKEPTPIEKLMNSIRQEHNLTHVNNSEDY